MDISLSYVCRSKGDAAARTKARILAPRGRSQDGHADQAEDDQQGQHRDDGFFALGQRQWHGGREREITTPTCGCG